MATLRGQTPEGRARRASVLVVGRAATSSSPQVSIYDPAADSGFPDGFVLSELADTRWTEVGGRIVLGVKEQEDEEEEGEAGDDEKVDVDVWYWADDRLQSVQAVQADADRRSTFASVYNVHGGRFVRLANEAMPRVDLTDDGRWARGLRAHRSRHGRGSVSSSKACARP